MVQQSVIIYFQIIAAITFCFGQSLFAKFVFDDNEALINNLDVNPGQSELFQLFKHDFWGNNITDSKSHRSYRPLTILLFRWIAKHSRSNINGLLKPSYYHAANLISYLILCCLLYETLRRLLTIKWIQKSSTKESDQLSLLTTLLFTIHPIHCESVVSCVGLADILSGLLCILSLRAYIKLVKSINNDHRSTILFSIVSVLFITLALLFKEQGITYLGLFILLNLIWLCYNGNKHCFQIYILIIFYLGSLLALLYFRMWIMDFTTPTFSKWDNPAWHISSKFYRTINIIYIYLVNSIIILCPIWLCFDWSMGTISLIESLEDMRIILLVLFVIFVMFVIFRLFYSISSNFERSLFIFGSFAALPFLPSSNLFFPVGFVIAERNLFMPILGYLLIFVTSYQRVVLVLPKAKRKYFHLFLYTLMVLLSIRSHLRTKDWMKEESLYENDSNVCPGNAKIFYNIGKVAADKGLFQKAMDNYRKALILNENYTNALNNYGNILKDNGQLSESRKLLQKAVDLDPKFATAWMNLAIVEMSSTNYQQSEKYFHRAIQLKPLHANTFYNLGNLYLEWKRFDMASHAYQQAHENNKQIDNALQLAKESIRFNPHSDSLHFLYANILGEMNEFEKAEYHFQQAIQINHTNPSYHYNLAVLYHRNKMILKAKELYKGTLEINPNHVGAIKQLQILEHK
ncbi:Protein O-mannosyl-transferase tmtc4 [Blomia tropicalis]|nr:Protein O-mannosyl-transferase tmtc4 [Blomia tropicalis]